MYSQITTGHPTLSELAVEFGVRRSYVLAAAKLQEVPICENRIDRRFISAVYFGLVRMGFRQKPKPVLH